MALEHVCARYRYSVRLWRTGIVILPNNEQQQEPTGFQHPTWEDGPTLFSAPTQQNIKLDFNTLIVFDRPNYGK